MSKLTALGLELDYDENSIDITPYSAIVVAEGFDSNGVIRHVVMNTIDMTNVTAGGLVNFARNWTDIRIMNDLVRQAYATEEE